MSDDCYPCRQERDAHLPPRENLLRTPSWRVAHAFNATLPGWLVLVPRSHLTAFADLSQDAAADLGPLIRELSIALSAVTGCVKTYVMQFAEAEGFGHLHVHLVPRAPDLPPDRKGPQVFGYLTEDAGQWLPSRELDDVSIAIASATAASGAMNGQWEYAGHTR